jgi:hypothetical protein
MGSSPQFPKQLRRFLPKTVEELADRRTWLPIWGAMIVMVSFVTSYGSSGWSRIVAAYSVLPSWLVF